MTNVCFAFALAKVMTSYAATIIFAFLSLLPDVYEVSGGKLVPFGGAARATADAGEMLLGPRSIRVES